MDRAELLGCMREAAGALAEFRHFLPVHCPKAVNHLEQALRHFDRALALCRESSGVDHDEGEGDDELPPKMRINR